MDSDNTQIPRRRVLRMAGGIGVAGSLLSIPATQSASASKPDVKVEKCHGWKHHRCIARSFADKEVQKIFRRFIREGFRPDIRDVTVTETHDNREKGSHQKSHAVIIPFITPNPEHEEAYIAWSSHDDWETRGFHSVHFDKSGDGEHDHWLITSYTVEEGEIVTSEEEVENFLGCDNVNLRCVLTIAASYVGLFAACAVCSSSLALPACAACIGAVLTWGAAILCDWCND